MVIPNFDTASYADNSTPYCTGKKFQNALLNLEKSDILLKLFTENYLTANPEKYHVTLITNNKLSLNLLNLSISNNVENYLKLK